MGRVIRSRVGPEEGRERETEREDAEQGSGAHVDEQGAQVGWRGSSVSALLGEEGHSPGVSPGLQGHLQRRGGLHRLRNEDEYVVDVWSGNHPFYLNGQGGAMILDT